MKSKRVGVVVGGGSPEHRLPPEQTRWIFRTLREAGHRVRPIALGASGELRRAVELAELDLVFIATPYAEECGAELLEQLEEQGIPHTGSSLSATTLAMDKLGTKASLVQHNLPTPRAYEVPRSLCLDELALRHGDFGFPSVVKPRYGILARGVRRVLDHQQLRVAVAEARRQSDSVLVERYVEGREIMIGFLGGRVLGAIELETASGMLDPAAKLREAGLEVHLPARLNPVRTQNLFMLAERALEALGVTGPAEVELRVTEEQNEELLEMNTQPSLSPTSPFVRLAEAAGFGLTELCEALLVGAELRATPSRSRKRPAELISMVQASQPAIVAAVG